MKKVLAFLGLFLVQTSAVFGATTLVRVIDGDTIVVNQDGQEKHVRIAGLDAPEISQRYGDDAKSYVENALAGNNFSLTLVGEGTDRYGRTLAKVILQNGHDLALDEITAGLAVAYSSTCGKVITNSQKYGYDPVPYFEAEATARIAKTGLWNKGIFESPCVYRKNRRLPKEMTSQEE